MATEGSEDLPQGPEGLTSMQESVFEQRVLDADTSEKTIGQSERGE